MFAHALRTVYQRITNEEGELSSAGDVTQRQAEPEVLKQLENATLKPAFFVLKQVYLMSNYSWISAQNEVCLA